MATLSRRGCAGTFTIRALVALKLLFCLFGAAHRGERLQLASNELQPQKVAETVRDDAAERVRSTRQLVGRRVREDLGGQSNAVGGDALERLRVLLRAVRRTSDFRAYCGTDLVERRWLGDASNYARVGGTSVVTSVHPG